MTTFDASLLNRFDKAIQHEWLETNGIGGYSCSTVIGTNTRKYHGLLVAATEPPVGRKVLVSKMEEKIYAGEKTYELSTNKYHGTIHPHGYIFLKEFNHYIFPEFIYRCNGIQIRKTIVAIQGENTVVIQYEVLKANKDFTLELTPLMAGRSHHQLVFAYDTGNAGSWFQDNVLRSKMNPNIPEVFISVPQGHYKHDPRWYFGFEYPEEHNRGEAGYEDLFSPGHLYVNLKAGDKVGIIISTANPERRDPIELIEQEKKRRKKLIKDAGAKHHLIKKLVLAGDQFLVEGKDHKKSIIAGYPWFCDWGRDTMISLPGLCLATGRNADAQQILRSYAKWVSQGMIPNRFPEEGHEPLYNTIDATLWFFIAAFKYYQATKDVEFVRNELLPVLTDIIEWHQKGTRYGIRVDEDGLLTGGEPGVQLTWMDAIVGDWVVTPRIGKAVEINALWYNACEIFAYFNHISGDSKQAKLYSSTAKKMKKAFRKAFWNAEESCLYDFIDRDYKDPSVRPNQLFAISLPFSLLTIKQSAQLLEKVESTLFTPRGLRSLSPEDQEYQGVYVGDRLSRDNAYHKGTVWAWLIGPFIDALIKVKGIEGRLEARIIVENFLPHFSEAGIGSISEIFDGNTPFTPRGCFAQAWSIAELLRVSAEYQLFGHQALIEDPIDEEGNKPTRKISKLISQEAKI